MKISVIICTHDPRAQYLERVLSSLRLQNLPTEQWELLLIDNKSHEILSSNWDLTWHPQSRHIREENLGLIHARLRGIIESSGEILIFVDDDNLLHNDYLEVALRISHEWPTIGVWGGSIAPEYEILPTDDIKPYLEGLAIKEIQKNYWTNIPSWSLACPYGAGMCVKRYIANLYLNEVSKSPIRRLLGRTGKQLFSAEDSDLAFLACDAGYGMGRFKDLRLTHLIPKKRLNAQYISSLYAGFAYSNILLSYIRGDFDENKYNQKGGLKRFIKNIYQDLCAKRQSHTAYLVEKLSRKAIKSAIDFLNDVNNEK